ncbi:PAS domain S-box protein [Coleofasciculus sp. FACHB-T130]|uniref:PAS domain S-box protein n=1 Tax=Cyanophyceae TaxID=3028117 RepID=UPI00168A29D0|nr:PAS domain S-box protein [Coleofasciculus sp. FACHB-T130]MBD1878258.1 PAS domain S-box protein [Coleofasciculus sp. FACHB-T130]
MQSFKPKVSEEEIKLDPVFVPENHSKRPPNNWLKQLIRRLSIRQKIGYGYAVAIGIATLGASAGLLVGEYYQRQMSQQLKYAQQEAYLLNSLKIAVLEARNQQQQLIYRLGKPKEFQREVLRLVEKIEKVKKLYSQVKLFGNESQLFKHSAQEIAEVENWLKTYDGTVEVYSQNLNVILNKIDKDGGLQPETVLIIQNSLLNFTNTQEALKFDSLSDDLTKLIEVANHDEEETAIALQQVEKLRIQIIVTSMLLSMAIAAIIARYSSRAIAHPLETATQIAQQVTEQANFTLQAPVITEDEVGRLTTSLNQLIRSVGTHTQELKQTQAQLHRFFNLSFDMLCVVGFDGYFKQINPAFETTLGYTGEEILAKPLLNFIHPEDRATSIAEARKLASGVMVSSFINRYGCKDGSYKWLEWTCVPFAPEGLIYAVARDISDRIHAETARQESEQQFRALVANIPGAIYRCSCDDDWKMEFISDAIAEISGYPPGDFIHNQVRSFASIIHPEDTAIVDRLIQEAVQKKQPFIIEYRIIRADGSIRWVYEKGQGIFNSTGQLLCLNGAIFDISDRKQTEEALHSSNRRVFKVLESITDAFYALNHQWQFTYINKQAELLLQRTRSELLGTNIWDRFPAAIGSNFYNQYHQSAAEQVSITFEEFYPALDIWVEVRAYPSEEGLSVYFHDITERKAAEKALAERARLAAFRADIGSALTQSDTLQGILQRCVLAVVKHLDAAFARIWMLNVEENVLELQASAGIYTHLNGNHRRVKVGQFKIGLIAQERKPHLTNSVLDDPRVSDKDWAKREGMVAFAGYPLMLQGQMVGVIAMFTRHTLSESIFKALEFAADEIAIGIKRKQAEEALQRSLKDLSDVKFALDQAAIVAITDRRGMINYVNDKFCEISKYSPKELIGQDHRILNSVYHPQEFFSKLWSTISSGKVWRGQIKNRAKDETYYWVDTAIVPVLDERGNPFQYLAICSDITDRKAAEEALRLSEARFRELAAQEELFNHLASQIRNSLELDTILETAVHEIYHRLHLDTCIFSWYRPDMEPVSWEAVKEAKKTDLRSWVGFFPDEAFGAFTEKILRQEIVRVDDVKTLNNDLPLQQLLLTTGAASVLGLPLQTQFGRIGLIICNRIQEAKPWTDADVALLCAIANQMAIAINQAELYADASNSAHLAQDKALQLEQTLQELQETQIQLIQAEKMSSLGQMVAGIAHEFNNPVNFIHGNLQHTNDYVQDLLNLVKLYQQQYSNTAPKIQSFVEKIDLEFIAQDLPKMLSSMKIGTQRIRELVLSLRNFSRLDEAEMKAVDLHEGMDNTLLILNNRLKKEINVIKHYGKLPLVECYPAQLNQVFMNILSNAIDALLAQKEREDKQIVISSQVLGKNQIIVRIRDNGSGIPQPILEKIFDPFFTTKDVGKGTGLGLSISYQIMEKHHGKIMVSSQMNEGTEFAIYLPIKQSGLSAKSVLAKSN